MFSRKLKYINNLCLMNVIFIYKGEIELPEMVEILSTLYEMEGASKVCIKID
jgi:hypothetical protein